MFICSAMIECYVFDSKQWGLPGYRVLFYYQGVKGLEAIGFELMSKKKVYHTTWYGAMYCIQLSDPSKRENSGSECYTQQDTCRCFFSMYKMPSHYSQSGFNGQRRENAPRRVYRARRQRDSFLRFGSHCTLSTTLSTPPSPRLRLELKSIRDAI